MIRAKKTQKVYQYIYSYNGEYGLTQDEGIIAQFSSI